MFASNEIEKDQFNTCRQLFRVSQMYIILNNRCHCSANKKWVIFTDIGVSTSTAHISKSQGTH